MEKTKTQEWSKEQTNLYYSNHAYNSYMELFPVLHHAIDSENFELYRLAKDAQDSIAKVEAYYKKLDKAETE